MRVVSLKRKAGRAYAKFGCSAHHGKGSAICGNGLVISERKLNSAVDSCAVTSASRGPEYESGRPFGRPGSVNGSCGGRI